jgi:hypothetical protein
MPWVTGSIGSEHDGEHGRYLCDHPGCSNVAKHVMGCAKEIGMFAALCDQHAKRQPAIREYRWTIT